MNQSLALEDEVLRGAQIRKFLILHKELDADDEEITRTRKVRRGYIAQKYAALIEALYGERDHVTVEAQVTYEDGRRGHGPRRRRASAELTPTVSATRRGRRPAAGSGRHQRAVRRAAGAQRGEPRACRRGEIVAIIGPNGAGKTTLLNVHQRLLPALRRAASVFAGRDRTRLSPPTTWPRSASRGPSRTSRSSGA